MDRGAWQAAAHGVVEECWTWLSDWATTKTLKIVSAHFLERRAQLLMETSAWPLDFWARERSTQCKQYFDFWRMSYRPKRLLYAKKMNSLPGSLLSNMCDQKCPIFSRKILHHFIEDMLSDVMGKNYHL